MQICSQILPYLYVSGAAIASNRAKLLEFGITHIINCSPEAVESPSDDCFRIFGLRLSDSKTQRIDAVFFQAVALIESVRETSGKILVHCFQGVSRSVALVAAYIMWRDSCSYDAAYQFVRNLRGVARPNIGFQCQLMLWRQIHFTASSKATEGSQNHVLYGTCMHPGIGLGSRFERPSQKYMLQLLLDTSSSAYQAARPSWRLLHPGHVAVLHIRGRVGLGNSGNSLNLFLIWSGADCAESDLSSKLLGAYAGCLDFVEYSPAGKGAHIGFVRKRDLDICTSGENFKTGKRDMNNLTASFVNAAHNTQYNVLRFPTDLYAMWDPALR